MVRIVLVLLVAAAGAGTAIAESTIPLTLRVGETVSQDVGWAMGHLCDDTSIVQAEIRNKDPDTNTFVVTGLKAGTTLCRAGVIGEEWRPSYLFEIRIVDAPRSPGPSRGSGPPRPAGPPPRR